MRRWRQARAVSRRDAATEAVAAHSPQLKLRGWLLSLTSLPETTDQTKAANLETD